VPAAASGAPEPGAAPAVPPLVEPVPAAAAVPAAAGVPEPEEAAEPVTVSALVVGPPGVPEQGATAPPRTPEPYLTPVPTESRREVAAAVGPPGGPGLAAMLEKRWSIWTLDRLARERDDDELKFLVFSLQDYADIDGLLPLEFDSLVRESFGEFLGTAAA
jgi:hypothetical protein